MRAYVQSFVAGFVSTLVFHQGLFYLLYASGRVSTAPYNLTGFAEDDHVIEDFKWTPDGRLTFSRSRTAWDLVLFRGVKREE